MEEVRGEEKINFQLKNGKRNQVAIGELVYFWVLLFF